MEKNCKHCASNKNGICQSGESGICGMPVADKHTCSAWSPETPSFTVMQITVNARKKGECENLDVLVGVPREMVEGLDDETKMAFSGVMQAFSETVAEDINTWYKAITLISNM